jgi:hypothetical protein
MAIPLCFGHGIECTLASNRQVMLSLVSKLDDVDKHLVTWVYAMHFSINHFDGILLNHSSLNINLAFFEPLLVIPELQPQIAMSVSLLVPNLPPVMQIHSHLSKVQKSNLNTWILVNKTFCDPIIDQYSVTLGSQPQQGGANQTPTQISVNIAKSATEEKNKVQKQKSLATICILLGTMNADSNELVPATLHQNYINLIEEGVAKAKDAMQNFQQQFGKHTKNHCGNINSVIENKMNMLMAAFVHGHYGTSLMHDAQTVVGQNLMIFSFLPARMESVSYKHVLDEANAMHGK